MKVPIEKITEVLLKELKFHVAMNDVEITLESKLEEDLDLDSLEVIELFLSLEDKFEGPEIDNRFMEPVTMSFSSIQQDIRKNWPHTL